MLEMKGNILDIDIIAICVPTNGILNQQDELVMGQGSPRARHLAKAFHDRWGRFGIAKFFGKHIQKCGNTPVACHLGPKYLTDGMTGEGYLNPAYKVLITFPTKHHWKDDSDIELIKQSARKLVEMTNAEQFERVAIPHLGCGRGKLRWEDVKEAIEPILDNRFVVVSLY